MSIIPHMTATDPVATYAARLADITAMAERAGIGVATHSLRLLITEMNASVAPPASSAAPVHIAAATPLGVPMFAAAEMNRYGIPYPSAGQKLYVGFVDQKLTEHGLTMKEPQHRDQRMRVKAALHAGGLL